MCACICVHLPALNAWGPGVVTPAAGAHPFPVPGWSAPPDGWKQAPRGKACARARVGNPT